MAKELLLEEDWKDYDDKQIRDNRDGNFFACSEKWEIDYLKNLIKRKFPKLSDQQISTAIEECCKSIVASSPRKTFVECVAKRLGI